MFQLLYLWFSTPPCPIQSRAPWLPEAVPLHRGNVVPRTKVALSMPIVAHLEPPAACLVRFWNNSLVAQPFGRPLAQLAGESFPPTTTTTSRFDGHQGPTPAQRLTGAQVRSGGGAVVPLLRCLSKNEFLPHFCGRMSQELQQDV